jgi:hypothetical protein
LTGIYLNLSEVVKPKGALIDVENIGEEDELDVSSNEETSGVGG